MNFSTFSSTFFFFLFLLTSSFVLLLLLPSLADANAVRSPFALRRTRASGLTPVELERAVSQETPEQAPQAPIVTADSQPVECSNASVRADFGTACLKKAITAGEPSAGPQQRPKRPTPGRTRYFAVKPMVAVVRRGGQAGIKSPALNARELYASKGYPNPVKSIRTVSGTSLKVYPNSPANKFYSMKPNQIDSPQASEVYQPDLAPSSDDEWRDADREVIVPAGEVYPQPAPARPVLKSTPPKFPRPPGGVSASSSQPAPTVGQYTEELEMLLSLKRSLGILSAQALNLRQRTVLLYSEARRRRLYFFDALLSRTNSFLGEKQEETRNAMADIETAIGQINQHHAQAAAAQLSSLRRTFYFYTPVASASATARTFARRRMGKKKRNSRQVRVVDPKELDGLILDALNHAKRMMVVVRELNEALDEFEEQFNLPRFEPNTVDDNSVEGMKEDF